MGDEHYHEPLEQGRMTEFILTGPTSTILEIFERLQRKATPSRRVLVSFNGKVADLGPLIETKIGEAQISIDYRKNPLGIYEQE